MSESAIRVQGLSKRYRLGETVGYHTLRESVTASIAAPLRRLIGKGAANGNGNETPQTNELWALRDVSFDIQPGEVLGIIGRNGAGKSTLLKLLSRITEPTAGRIELRGRVASLLEVGTGFHPELTGRENIYLNGGILGMRRREIDRKFDEIVAFSEVERFLDTPVKRYSSGMYMRLAFAVAAHLEPEILIVDEVLAVGDVNFQRKCLTKMQDVGQHGRTVLFVSHNMTAVTRLCPRAIVLSAGRIIADGKSHEVVASYLRSGSGVMAERTWSDLSQAPGNDIVRLCSMRIRTEAGEVSEAIDVRQSIGVEMEFEVLRPGHVLVPNIHFFNDEGVYAFILVDHDPEWNDRPRPTGTFVSTARIPGNFLAEGTMTVSPSVSTFNPFKVHFMERDVVAFQVTDAGQGDSSRGSYVGPFPGVVRPKFPWSTRFEPCVTANGALSSSVGAR